LKFGAKLNLPTLVNLKLSSLLCGSAYDLIINGPTTSCLNREKRAQMESSSFSDRAHFAAEDGGVLGALEKLLGREKQPSLFAMTESPVFSKCRKAEAVE
jgi:hypothetical protein